MGTKDETTTDAKTEAVKGPVKEAYNFPEHGIVVQASSLADAEEQLAKQLKEDK